MMKNDGVFIMKKIMITSGEVLKEEFLEPLGISNYKLAQEIHVSSTLIGKIVNGKTAITANIALRLATFFGTTPEFWLNLQNLCDLQIAEEELERQKIVITPLFQAAM
jgi:addiction module HigA family antidote